MSPPRRRASSREIDRPSPVPPKRRLVLPSAWRKASKITSCCDFGMPMPVSCTAKATRPASPASAPSAAATGIARSVTWPRSVNFSALAIRFFSTCCRRSPSVCRRAGRPCSATTWSLTPFCIASGSKVVRSRSSSSSMRSGASDRSALPASILDRSSTSLISASRSLLAAWMVCAYFTWSAVSVPSRLSASRRERISALLSGVRSSCDMLARNSDL